MFGKRSGAVMTRGRYTTFATGLSAGHGAFIFAFLNPERIWSREVSDADSATLALVVILPMTGVLLAALLFWLSTLWGDVNDSPGFVSKALAALSGGLFLVQVAVVLFAAVTMAALPQL